MLLPNSIRFSLQLALFCTLSAIGCSGTSATIPSSEGADSAAPVVASRLSGRWRMTWTSVRGATGGGTFQFVQEGNSVTGDVMLTGSPCFTVGQFAGTLSGSDLRGTTTAGANRMSIEGAV